jgi:hypothetical protein
MALTGRVVVVVGGVHHPVSLNMNTVIPKMTNAGFWDIKPQFVPQRRHYVSATESRQLMLCKI